MNLVVVGADFGKGKREGIMTRFLMAAWNEEAEYFQTICKCGSGFSDQQYDILQHNLKPLLIPAPSSQLRFRADSIKCDQWIEPRFVWEIKSADLSLSTVHTAW